MYYILAYLEVPVMSVVDQYESRRSSNSFSINTQQEMAMKLFITHTHTHTIKLVYYDICLCDTSCIA
jgi:hypothetical protein